jgi:SAM-dependent methyltransferase
MSKAKDYLDGFGFEQVSYSENIEDILVRKLGKELGLRISREIDARAEGRSRLSHQEFYTLKNTTLDSSLAVTGIFEWEHLTDSLEWLEAQIDMFHGKVLDIGCDQGIAACFIAKIRPDLDVVGIDMCTESVRNAQELASRLNIKNVSFRSVALKDLDDRFDSVIAMRTLSENFNTRANYDVSQSLINRGRFYRDLMRDYASQIDNVLNPDGCFFSVDRDDWVGMSLGWMMALQERGLGIDAQTCTRYTQEEAAHTVSSISFMAQKGVERDENSLYVEFNRTFAKTIDPCAPYYQGEQAALVFQNSVRGTVFCFNVYAKDTGKCWAQFGAFTDDDPTSIMMYVSRYDETGAPYIELGNYDISRKDEILEELYETRSVYIRAGRFRAVEYRIPEKDMVMNRKLFRIKPSL